MTCWWDEAHEAVVVYLPLAVDEAVHPNEDGSYTVFLNEAMCEARRIRAYRHALAHIRRNDFAAGSVQTAEISAREEAS